MTPREVVALVSPRHSAAVQARALVAWAAAHDVSIARTVDTSADAVGEVCEDVRKGVVAGAVAVRLDVLGDLVEQEAVRAVLARLGGELFVADEHDEQLLAADTADEPRQLLRLFDARRETLTARAGVARLQRGASKKRAVEGRSGGRTRYGERMVAGVIVEDAQEMAIVTRVEALWKRGDMGYSTIGRQLQAEGYRKRDGSDTWHPDTVRRIVKRLIEDPVS